MRIVAPSANLESSTPEPQRVVERAGRTCYRSEGKAGPDTAPAFCRMLIARGHESVLEHASATFRIVCDRGVSHELVRHRIASFSQESTRYCDYAKTDGLEFIEPPGMKGGARDTWILAVEAAEHSYLELRRRGVPPGIARSVLPNALRTEIVITANLREWRTIISQRCSSRAHPQMRDVMCLVRASLLQIAPAVFEDLEVVP